jgi:hypothetical protein
MVAYGFPTVLAEEIIYHAQSEKLITSGLVLQPYFALTYGRVKTANGAPNCQATDNMTG